MRVVVLGGWHLGAVAAVVVSTWGREVEVWDRDPHVRAELASGRPLIDEPGLADGFARAGDHLWVQRGDAPELGGADVLLVAYDTPVDDEDRPDLSPIREAVDLAAAGARPGALVLVHSQLPLGAAAALRDALDARGREDLLLAVTPENLRLGRALADFAEPRALTVGADDRAAAEAAQEFWAPTGVEVEVVGTATAELSKHVINATLAACTALGNELADVAASAGADPVAAARLARRDPRLASLPLLPGMPFGGGTLARDLGVLADRGGEESLAAAVRRANSRRLDRLAGRAAEAGGPIAVLGLTYKPGTSTLRRSMALELARRIAGLGIDVRAHDPHTRADDPALAEPGAPALVGLGDAVRGAATVIVATAHPEFREIEPEALRGAGTVTIIDLVGGLDRRRDWTGIELQGP